MGYRDTLGYRYAGNGHEWNYIGRTNAWVLTLVMV